MDNIPSYILGFLITALVIWSLQPVARFFGLVDHPGGRKRHKGTVPLIGGLAMYLGLVSALSAAGEPPLSAIIGLLAGGGLVLLVGTIDDFIDLSAISRFLTQITAAMIMVASGGVMLEDLGHLTGNTILQLDYWAIPLTIFATVGVINAINMSDGADGLAGGLSLVSLCALGIMAGIAGHPLFYLFPALITVLLAFLGFNIRTPWRRKAQVFMGNGGSMLLGFIMAWVLIKLSQGSHAVISPAVALWLFAIPLMDTVTIMLRRIFKRRSPFAPDRQHFHHALIKAGYSVSQAVWIMIGLSALLAGFGMLGHYGGVPEATLFYAFIVLFFIYFFAMNRTWRQIIIHRRRNLVVPSQKNNTGGGSSAVNIKAIKRNRE